MQRAFESHPAQLTVTEAAGMAVNAAAAVQLAKANHTCCLVTSTPAARQPQTVGTMKLGARC